MDSQSIDEDASDIEGQILSDVPDDVSGDSDSEVESESDHGVGPESIPDERPRQKQNSTVRFPQRGSKRQIEPVIKLTYDEPGKAKDHPITIVHRGIIIKVG